MLSTAALAAPEPVDELGKLRRDLSAAILTEDWDAVRDIAARLEQLDESGAPPSVSCLVRRACQEHGVLAVSEVFGFSRHAILSVAADVPSLPVLIAVQSRLAASLAELAARTERREARRAKADAEQDLVADAREEKKKNGSAHKP